MSKGKRRHTACPRCGKTTYRRPDYQTSSTITDGHDVVTTEDEHGEIWDWHIECWKASMDD